MKTMGRNEPFDWNVLVPHIVNPTKVAVIEALSWIGEPLSPTDLTKLITGNRKSDLSRVSYHVRTLAKTGVLREIWRRPVRGSTETFYFFS